ncbi:uncharacterized protein LOC110977289 [Acanthaster planci]|uniref:Uncharacterized protein LOC110977289 n=1 Tax=Acanthaster planci TaxID=133434 RepID=A0A8B7Y368_ACAPL|nr:uncharacterized protein LOC110977289 [Acanthaster planci]
MRKFYILALLLICIGYSQAKFCYSCTGYEGSSCDREVFFREDPRIGKIECPRYCLKRFTKDEFGRRITIRGCGGDGCEDKCDASGDECTYCCQMHDLCNGAGAVTFSLALVAGAAMLARLI